MTSHSEMICLGTITKPHGIKGHVCINSYCDNPEDIFSYAPLTNIQGTESYVLRKIGVVRDLFIAEVEGVTSRNAAELLAKTNLYISKDQLPMLEAEDDDMFYVSDLVGLHIFNAANVEIGKIVGVDNYGAGDVLDCRTSDHEVFMLPFSHDVVTDVDIEQQRVIVSEIAEQFITEQGDSSK